MTECLIIARLAILASNLFIVQHPGPSQPEREPSVLAQEVCVRAAQSDSNIRQIKLCSFHILKDAMGEEEGKE